MEAVDQNIVATLLTPQTITPGSEQSLVFSLTNNGHAVKDIRPYLGAFGHVVILRHNAPEDFLHVHPITEIQPTDGTVAFATTFPTSGRYTLYGQFNVEGVVKTFPITIDVTKNGVNAMQHLNSMDHTHH